MDDKDYIDLETIDRMVEVAKNLKTPRVRPARCVCGKCRKSFEAWLVVGGTLLLASKYEKEPIKGLCDDCREPPATPSP